MSENYLPLFRKYRPQSFKDLVGQENLVKALTNAIELKRIALLTFFAAREERAKLQARVFLQNHLTVCKVLPLSPARNVQAVWI